MLGFALGEVALGEIPLGGGPVTVVTIGWYSNLSEPVHFKRDPKAFPALVASGMAPISPWALAQPEHVSIDRWLQPLSKPQKLEKTGLRAANQQFKMYGPDESLSFRFISAYWPRFSEPVRIKKSLGVANQQFKFHTQAFPFEQILSPQAMWPRFSEPVRIKKSLDVSNQQFRFYTEAQPFPEIPYLPARWPRFSEPVRIKKSLDVSSQKFNFYVEPAPFHEVVFMPWYRQFDHPVWSKKGTGYNNLWPSYFMQRPNFHQRVDLPLYSQGKTGIGNRQYWYGRNNGKKPNG